MAMATMVARKMSHTLAIYALWQIRVQIHKLDDYLDVFHNDREVINIEVKFYFVVFVFLSITYNTLANHALVFIYSIRYCSFRKMYGSSTFDENIKSWEK
jgi:hypothetical protein